MGIQSSINSLLSQAQSLAAFYTGFKKADNIIRDTTATKKEAQIQTDIAAGNAPMKDGKVDPEWLQKKRDEFYRDMFDYDGKLTRHGEEEARFLENKIKRGGEFKLGDIEFYTDDRVQDYLKSFNEKNARFESALDTLESSISPELQNEVARKVAEYSVKSRTNNINKTKSDFKKHLIGVKKDKGSELT